MSARRGVQVTVKAPVDGGESPNAYVPYITAHIRVYCPPHTVNLETVHDALVEAVGKAVFAMAHEWADGRLEPPKNIWVVEPNEETP